MTWTLGVALVALAIALAALLTARRARRQNAQLTELYWQLKFDHGEVKAKVFPAEPPKPPAGFVPLGDVKKPGSRP